MMGPFLAVAGTWSGEIRPDRLVLGVAFPRFAALLAAIAAHLEATARRLGMGVVPGVRPDRACLDPVGEPQRAADIARLDARGEPVARIVGDPDRIVLVLERDQRQDRTENLLARYSQLIARVGEDGRLDEEALAVDLAGAAARGQTRGALALFDIGQELFIPAARRDRPVRHWGIERVAERRGHRHGAQLLDDLVIAGPLDQQARSGDA